MINLCYFLFFTQLQADSTRLADAVHIWLSLLNNSDLQHHHQSIKDRFEKAMKPVHYLAYMTDPRYLGKKL